MSFLALAAARLISVCQWSGVAWTMMLTSLRSRTLRKSVNCSGALPSLVNCLGYGRGMAFVDITDGDDVAESGGAFDVPRAHAAAADEGDARPIVRRRNGRRLLLRASSSR